MKKESWVIRFRWPILIGCFLIAAFMGVQLRNIQVETDPQKLMPETMPSRVNTDKIEKIFGSSDILFFVFESQDVLSEKTLRRIKTLSKEFHRLRGIKDVLSLFDTKRIFGENGEMIVDPAVKSIPETEADRESLRRQLLDNELAAELVVSKDFHLTAILLTLTTSASKHDLYLAASQIVKQTPGEEKVYVGGIPAFQTMMSDDINRDMRILIPIALLIMLGVLYWFFRQRRGVILPFFVVLLSMVFGMGFLPLMGWKVTVLTSLLPVMVVAFSNNYGIYLIAKYQELSRLPGMRPSAELASESFQSLYMPVFFTGLITIVGILGLLSHIMVPAKQIGIAAAAAIGFSLFVSLGGIPAALSLMKVAEKRQEVGGMTWPLLDKALAYTARVIASRPGTILTITALLVVLGLGGALLINVDANQENLFSAKHPISQSTRLINLYFGGSQSLAVLFEGNIKDPALLKRMEHYKDELKQVPGVGQIASIADVLRIMSKALNDKDEPSYNKIPETQEAVAQYLELYSMSGDPDDLEKLVDFNYEKALFLVRIKNGATPVIKRIIEKIESLTKDDKNVKLIGGYAVVFAELADTLIRGQVDSILFALGAIVILVILLFRSPAAGIISAVPIGMSIVFGFGIMGSTGINLDTATAMITSIVMGTGVDFTIQFLWKYRSERQKGSDYQTAVWNTLTTTGRAIFFNAVCVVSGFSALFFSSMPPFNSFALLFSVLTLACMAGTLITVPALCLVWKPKFLEPAQPVA